ncbi:MAG TPA: hypothetical protein VF069_21985 [Streptosporangiaceae bacterium]
MTTAAPPAEQIGITIDPWDPDYGTSLSAEAISELDATTAELDLDIEVPAASWAPITPAASRTRPRTLLIADGVRRIDARVWVNKPSELPIPGFAASYAAGLVRCEPGTGSLAMLTGVGIRRSLFTPSHWVMHLRTTAGDYTVETTPDATVEKLAQALQQRLTELEVQLATEYRATADDEDLLIVDGPLRGRSHLPRTVGYIKTHHAPYLSGSPATVVGALAEGQRTPVFLVGTRWRRHSWYLRLPTRSTAPWAGIARCEAATNLSAKELTELADITTLLLPGLAGVDYKDPRAPQNLIPIGGLEKLLRHRLGHRELLYRALRVAATRLTEHS